MDEQKVRLFFNMGERPVKLLLGSYFELFEQNKLLDFCEKQGISTKKIPIEYKHTADMISIKNELSDKFLQHESILKVPPKAGDMNIERSTDGELWNLKLDIVDANKKWDETPFTTFGEQAKGIKQHIGNMFMMCRFVLDCLKAKNKELSTLSLDIDPENITIKLKDSRFPNYEHTQRIGHVLTKVEGQ